MSQNSVALLAAGIPAFMAAATFTVGQVIGAMSSIRRQRRLAVLRLLDALDRMPKKAAAPPILQIWSHPELEVYSLANRLIIHLSKRDEVIWEEVRLRVLHLIQAKGEQRMEMVGETQAILILFLKDSKKARNYVRTGKIAIEK